METVCVLGGTGFVGRRLAARLAGDHHLRVLSRSAMTEPALRVIPSVRQVHADVYDPATLRRHFEGCAAVVNLVGILNEKARDGSGFRRAHVELAHEVVRACADTGVRRLLHMSALKANAEAGPSHYLRTKGEAENIVRRAAGLDATIFQPSVIFGPEDSFVNRFASMLRLLPVLPLPRANARFAPVYVGDVVEAFARALTRRDTFGKTFQLCGPEVYSLREIIGFIARTLGKRRLVLALPDSVARLQARVMDYVPGKPFSTDNYLSLTVNSLCDNDGFDRLGIEPRSMRLIAPRYLAGSVDPLDRFRQLSGR